MIKYLHIILGLSIIFFAVLDALEVADSYKPPHLDLKKYGYDSNGCFPRASLSLAVENLVQAKSVDADIRGFVDWSYVNQKYPYLNQKYPYLVGIIVAQDNCTLLMQAYDKKHGFLCSEYEFIAHRLTNSGKPVKIQFSTATSNVMSKERMERLNAYPCHHLITELCLIPDGQDYGKIIYSSENRTMPTDLYDFKPDIIAYDKAALKMEALLLSYSNRVTDAIATFEKLLGDSIIVDGSCRMKESDSLDKIEDEVHTRRLLALHFLFKRDFELAEGQYALIRTILDCVRRLKTYSHTIDETLSDEQHDMLFATFARIARLDSGKEQILEFVKQLEATFNEKFTIETCDFDLDELDKRIGLPGVFWYGKLFELLGNQKCSSNLLTFALETNEKRLYSYGGTRRLNYAEKQWIKRTLNAPLVSQEDIETCLGNPGSAGRCIYNVNDDYNYSIYK